MINIIGPLLDTQGYAIHTRNLANALSKITDVRISTTIPPGSEGSLSDKELFLVKKQPVKDEINLIITTPMHWRMSLGKRNWAFLVWEGDRIPKSFVDECANEEIEYIFVPSNHTKKAIITTFDDVYGKPAPQWIYDKIKVMPHGVNLDLFYPRESGSSNTPAGPIPGNVPETTFLANKGFRNLEDRGGIQYLIKSYVEEFTDKDKVRLIIKLNPVYGIPDMNQMVKQITEKRKDMPKVDFITDLLTYESLFKVYHQGDVFVSPTRAEAFNLPGAEAKACGLMTVQTGFGGQTDYMKEGTDLFIDYDLVKVEHEIMYEETRWAKPKIKDIKDKLRWCHDNPEEVKKRGKQAREEIKKFTWDKTAQKIVDLI